MVIGYLYSTTSAETHQSSCHWRFRPKPMKTAIEQDDLLQAGSNGRSMSSINSVSSILHAKPSEFGIYSELTPLHLNLNDKL